jgi:hypothetical protein
MKFIPRLRRLEAHRRQHAPACSACDGTGGRGATVVIYEEDNQSPPQPCGVCGREPLVIHVVYRTGANVLAQE